MCDARLEKGHREIIYFAKNLFSSDLIRSSRIEVLVAKDLLSTL